jgi:hypothetical protein
MMNHSQNEEVGSTLCIENSVWKPMEIGTTNVLVDDGKATWKFTDLEQNAV